MPEFQFDGPQSGYGLYRTPCSTPPKSDQTLQEGKTYTSREGETVTIKGRLSVDEFVGDNNLIYTSEGKYLDGTEEGHPLYKMDLIID